MRLNSRIGFPYLHTQSQKLLYISIKDATVQLSPNPSAYTRNGIKSTEHRCSIKRLCGQPSQSLTVISFTFSASEFQQKLTLILNRLIHLYPQHYNVPRITSFPSVNDARGNPHMLQIQQSLMLRIVCYLSRGSDILASPVADRHCHQYIRQSFGLSS